MKKYTLLALVQLLALLAGCNNSVNPKKLVGVWEVYDSSNPGYVGNQHTYFLDGRRLIKGMWDSGYDMYEVNGNYLYIFKNKEVQKDKRDYSYTITLKGNILEIRDDRRDSPYWVKLKKISNID